MTRQATFFAAYAVYGCCGDPATAFFSCPSGNGGDRVLAPRHHAPLVCKHKVLGTINAGRSWKALISRSYHDSEHLAFRSSSSSFACHGSLKDRLEEATTLRYYRSAVAQKGRGRGLSMSQSPVNGQQQEDSSAYEVVFVRHGQSTWNKANRFIGWTDTELTEEGEIEARVAGQVLLAEGFEFDVVYTSMLKRAIKTAWVVLDELSQQHVPVIPDWHLNERCYGALVGREKKECVRHYGAQQVKVWRRSYDVPPPPIDRSSKLWPGNNPRYKFLAKDGESLVPVHESLKDVMKRSSVYWDEVIAPMVREGKRVCICGHENNLRSLLKHVDGISDEDITNVELPRAVPLVYRLDANLKPIRLEGAAPYLSGEYAGDPEEIAAIMERDRVNVYDLSVVKNLEESETRFAAKLEDVVQPCDVEHLFGPDAIGDEHGEFLGTFLETGIGNGDCRDSAITSTPLLLYNRGQKKKRPSPPAPPPSPPLSETVKAAAVEAIAPPHERQGEENASDENPQAGLSEARAKATAVATTKKM